MTLLASDLPVVRSGQIYRWAGLAGQYATEARIRVDSTTAFCAINGAIFDEEEISLVTIPAADFVAAVQMGWLVLIDEPLTGFEDDDVPSREALQALVAALHKTLTTSRRTDGASIPDLIETIVNAGWRPINGAGT